MYLKQLQKKFNGERKMAPKKEDEGKSADDDETSQKPKLQCHFAACDYETDDQKNLNQHLKRIHGLELKVVGGAKPSTSKPSTPSIFGRRN